MPDVSALTQHDGWSAVSADGYEYERIEDEGLPWMVTHPAFPGWGMLAATLEKARRYAPEQLHLDLTVNLEGR